MNRNLVFSWRGWMGRWLAASMNGAIADRLAQLERQIQTYQQENIALKQQLQVDQVQLQTLWEQVNRLEQRVQSPPELKGNRFSDVDRQLSRIWQYYQDAKIQFEKINRQIQQQKTASEETTQKFHQKISKINALHRSEIRDLKQQLDQLAFSVHHQRQVQTPDPDLEPFS